MVGSKYAPILSPRIASLYLMIHVFPLIRLMVNLTQPAMICFGKVPDDPVFRHHFLEVTSHLQAYKEVSSALDISFEDISFVFIMQ